MSQTVRFNAQAVDFTGVAKVTIPKLEGLIKFLEIIDNAYYVVKNDTTKEVVACKMAEAFEMYMKWQNLGDKVTIQQVDRATATVLYGNKG